MSYKSTYITPNQKPLKKIVGTIRTQPLSSALRVHSLT
jgi:hypothetical protein